MPTIPQINSLKATGIDILNAIRANASSTYQERIPVATQDNIRAIGNAMLEYQATANEFLSALVNRIGRVLITSKSFSNPLARFKKGVLEYGEAVEEVFVEIARAQQFDPERAEKEFMKREIPDVSAVFHKLNLKNFYKTTVSNEMLRQAFLNETGITDLIGKIIDSLYEGAEFDEYLTMKQLISDAANNGQFYPVKVPVPSKDTASDIVTEIKAVSNALEFRSSKYNSMGVLTLSKKSEQILIMDAKFDAVVDVNVLASAFNMDKAEFMGQRVLVDNFADLTGVVACLVDEDWFMVFDNWLGFTENYNGQGLYWNYFYHVWKTFSTSPFANAVLFTSEDIDVTSVTLTPNTATVAKGQSVQFTAEVTGTGYIPKDVVFYLEGDEEITSTITATGLLTVSANEANTSLTVIAKSVYDNTVQATATVTIQ